MTNERQELLGYDPRPRQKNPRCHIVPPGGPSADRRLINVNSRSAAATESPARPLSQTVVKALIKHICGQANLLTIPRVFISLTGDHLAALLLSQILYWWERRSPGLGDWFYKSHEDWHEELALSPFQIRRALVLLGPLGVKTVKRKVGGAPTLHYSIDEKVFNKRLIEHLETPPPRTSKVKKLHNREAEQSEHQETVQSEGKQTARSEPEQTQGSFLTETTSEITSKITRTSRARCSRFDLPTCERYAASLRGIDNPAAYANTIYDGKHAGRDDEKIDAWVSQTSAAPSTRQLEGEPRPQLLAGLLQAVHSRVNAESYAQWFEPITQLTVEGDLIRLGVPNKTAVDWIKNNYYDVLEEAITEAIGKPMRYQMVALTSGAGTTKGAGPIKPNPQIAASVQS